MRRERMVTSQSGMRLSIVRGLLCTLAALAWLVPRPAQAIELDAISKAAAGYTVGDAKLQSMYRAALLNTNKQVTIASDGTAYIKTGDIPAEWLRDASVQVRPYLFFAKNDEQVRVLLRGAIARMGKYLQVDPYANAFTLGYGKWEEKFELDSLAYPITLAWTYWKQTGDASVFTGDLSLGFDSALATMEREQDHPRNSKYTHPQMPNGGKGNPVAYTGMIWSGFRPSDDACALNYLIPSEMMAVVALGKPRGDRARRLSQPHQGAAREGAARRSADRDSNLRRRVHAELRLYLCLRSRRAREREHHGRRERAVAAFRAVSGLHQADVVHLPEHAQVLALKGQFRRTMSASSRAESVRRTRPTTRSGRSR